MLQKNMYTDVRDLARPQAMLRNFLFVVYCLSGLGMSPLKPIVIYNNEIINNTFVVLFQSTKKSTN